MGVLFALSPADLALEPIAQTNLALHFPFASHSSLTCRVELYLIEKRSGGARQNGGRRRGHARCVPDGRVRSGTWRVPTDNIRRCLTCGTVVSEA
jgi:hypothetical protein